MTGLKVHVDSGEGKFATDAEGTRLSVKSGTKAGEFIVKLDGPSGYDLVFTGSGTGIAISLRGPSVSPMVQAWVDAHLEAGSDPIQARVDGMEDDVAEFVRNSCHK